ncbi:hypothetical protein [Methylophaga sulfidovorans]|uniref:Pentapeptide MXKDX repeat protein n=1 Tax=Methylophaga sulfidovorans TaxID=45496 RepID=A0A1I3XFG4_9GAMM|nr:hypothetical protein [Methylophaga sulfidovorans]SFK18230.1 hypothetical protein SAMN04488079_10640 [Methylophaga sulfidovorans]
MLKTQLTTLLSVVMAILFSSSVAFANEHETSHEGAKHPAHEMGEELDTVKDKKLSEDYKDNMEEAEDSANSPHPAHEMGENEELQERGQ